MPLSQSDPALDYDGSWGDASEGWPSMWFETEAQANAAYVASWRDCKVPYGSFVLVGNVLRLEKQEYVDRVAAHLEEKGR